jgi:hypothetical protein
VQRGPHDKHTPCADKRVRLRLTRPARLDGLGKTIEAALIIKELSDASPGLRVLYLAPAGLVRNVQRELDRIGLAFRCWIAGDERDARLTDSLVVASIHRAVHPAHRDAFLDPGLRWDVLVVDECHHLSDWGQQGGKPTRKYKLVQDLIRKSPDARLILMSGTPHQGHQSRFENLVALLRRGNEPPTAIAGRVIYRTKEDGGCSRLGWRAPVSAPQRAPADRDGAQSGPSHVAGEHPSDLRADRPR